MITSTSCRGRAGTLLGLLAAAVLIAGCGGGAGSSSHSRRAATASGSAGTSSTPRITTARSAVGTYLAGAGGRALYLWDGDTRGRSNCAGRCAKVWAPLLVAATPSVAGAASAGQLGTITRSDGGKQLTYSGHPLYYFAQDTTAGTDRGQGQNAFGARWWLVAPSGSAITATGSSSAKGSSSSSGYGSGY